jgi:hypothetical protein
MRRLSKNNDEEPFLRNGSIEEIRTLHKDASKGYPWRLFLLFHCVVLLAYTFLFIIILQVSFFEHDGENKFYCE